MDTRKKKSISPGKGRPVEKRHKAQRPQQNAARREPQPAARNPRQLTPEQRRRTDRAYRQATVHRDVRSKRRGKRGANFVMYYILAAAVIITVLIILSNTVLFNCASIEVEGNARYTVQQLVGQSGLEKGQNLLHMDTGAAESRILAAFPFIEVEVQKSFPTKIRIVVKEAQKWYQVSSGGVNAAISRMGRIVELGSTPGIPVVEGYDPEDLSPGKTLTSKESGKSNIPAQILEAAEECGLQKITLINMTDRFDISIDCGDNITLQIGGVADIGVKFAEAAEAIKREEGNVIIDLRTEEKMFVRDKNEQEQVLPELGESAETTAEAGTAEGSAEG